MRTTVTTTSPEGVTRVLTFGDWDTATDWAEDFLASKGDAEGREWAVDIQGHQDARAMAAQAMGCDISEVF